MKTLSDGSPSHNGQVPKRTGKRQTIPLHVASEQEDDSQEAELDDVCAADIKAKQVRWLWQDALEWGTVAVFQGAKGAGKSTWMRAIAAHVTGGPALPGTRKLKKPLGAVLWYAGEESVDSRVRPALEAAGADLSLCFVSDAYQEDQRRRLSLPGDAERLQRRIVHRGAVLVVIDPLFCFLDGSADVEAGSMKPREYMTAVGKVAEATGCVILLARNITKMTKNGAINSGRGSGEIGNQARSVLHAHQLAGSKTNMALAIAACNNGSPKDSVLYHLENKDGYATIAIDGTSGITADDLVSGDDGDTERFLLDQAKELIRQLLGKDRVDSKVIKSKAEASMIGVRTLQTAAKQLKVRHTRVGSRENTVVYWSPPKGGFTT